jgi:predicted DNA binding CopG/RHH family protein
MKKVPYLDDEERELIESYERGEYVLLPKKEEDALKKKLQKAAREHRLKNQKSIRVNLRMPEADLQMVREKAVIQGLPYQTLISSIVHQYVTGNLKSVH